METTREFEPFLTAVAEESGDLIRRYFLSSSLRVDMKADRTVVTQADREAEALIRDRIRKRFPDHGVIGEEFGNENENAEFVWIIDPIDGTISFVAGVPLFGSLIGLLHRGRPVLGCIHQPVTRLLCIGDNEQARLNGVPCKVRETGRLEDAVLLGTDLSSVEKYQSLERFEELRGAVKLFRTWGDCYGYLLLAIGRADIMLDPIMNPWDLLPVIPVVRGAGGVISGYRGETAEEAQSCLAATPGLHPQVVKMLQP